MNNGLPVYVMRISKSVFKEDPVANDCRLKMVEENLHRSLNVSMMTAHPDRFAGLPDRDLCRFYSIAEDENNIIVKMWVGLDDRP